MKKENAIEKLTEAGFEVAASNDSFVAVSIFEDMKHQAEYVEPCAEAVVLPLLDFCSDHHLTMRRCGRMCVVAL